MSGAVAGPACIYALDPSGSGTFSVTGNANITAQCGIVDESSSSSGLSLSGNITLTATSIGVYGPGFSKSGNVTISPQPVPKIASLPDPLATQAKNAAPTVGTCSQAVSTSGGSYSNSGIITTVNLTPAVYSGGMSITGNIER